MLTVANPSHVTLFRTRTCTHTSSRESRRRWSSRDGTPLLGTGHAPPRARGRRQGAGEDHPDGSIEPERRRGGGEGRASGVPSGDGLGTSGCGEGLKAAYQTAPVYPTRRYL